MNENEIQERYIRLVFQYESAIDALLSKGLVDMEAPSVAKERFYDTLNEERLRTEQKIKDYHEAISLYIRKLSYDSMVSLTELARQYSDESPGYVIQSWMRSRNTLEFLRQWELDRNAEFDDQACAKQVKGGGVSAYPEIAADFRLWLDPKMRLAVVRQGKMSGQ
jgi:hypothetical protein